MRTTASLWRPKQYFAIQKASHKAASNIAMTVSKLATLLYTSVTQRQVLYSQLSSLYSLHIILIKAHLTICRFPELCSLQLTSLPLLTLKDNLVIILSPYSGFWLFLV